MEHIKKFEELEKPGFRTVDAHRSGKAAEYQKSLDDMKNMPEGDLYDKYFIQEISDRLNGPDAKQYIEELRELNAKYRAREGKAGNQFFDPAKQEDRIRREEEIIKKFSM